jgi:hypothetical protein
MAKHSALTRASGVRVPGSPRCLFPGSANGRPLRSERRYPGSSPGPGTFPLGDRLTAGQQALTLLIEVRVLVPEQSNTLTDKGIVDDARGRAPPRPQRRPCSRSGDGARLKRGRCWFDSRRGHDRQGGARVDERRFREPEAAGADPATLTNAPVARRSCSRSISGRAWFDSERAHCGLRVGCGLGPAWSPKPSSGVRFLDGPPAERATEWPVTGLENRGSRQ